MVGNRKIAKLFCPHHLVWAEPGVKVFMIILRIQHAKAASIISAYCPNYFCLSLNSRRWNLEQETYWDLLLVWRCFVTSRSDGMDQEFNPRISCSTWTFVVLLYLLDAIPLLSFLTAQCGLQFSPRGLRPSCSLMTARHLDQNTMGYLQWRWGPTSAMTTSVVRDTKRSHFTLAIQVIPTFMCPL